MVRRALIMGAIGAAGCRGAPDHDGFGSISTMSPPAGSSTGEISSSTDASTSSGSTTSTGTSGDSTGPRLDLGAGPDLEPAQPAGCQGKIDFLFVISSGQYVEDLQAKLAEAFPKFIETIETKFADFDFHILVTDGSAAEWGNVFCNEDCPNVSEAQCGKDYPCYQLEQLGPCETTWGAGTVFNAGFSTMNKPCGVAGGRRYLTREQPDLPGTFQCVARVGSNGGDLLGLAVTGAVSPELNGPGGCNEGFLRDDALLVVTFATATGDDNSPGTPAEWAQVVIDAKHGDPDAVVAFGIGPSGNTQWCWKYDTVCQMFDAFPHSHWIDQEEPDYAPGFDAATNLVKETCDQLIPQ
jgi:hypothetical protein